MTAQEYLHRNLEAIQSAAECSLLLNKSLSDKLHNDRARLLRAGVFVRGFAAIEQFLRSRVQEILSNLPKNQVAFSSLPVQFRGICTREALKGLQFQAGLRKRRNEDWEGFIQMISAQVASTSQSAYEIPSVAFGQSSSNLDALAVKELLSSLSLVDPWSQMGRLSTRMAMSSPDLQGDFRNITSKRHDCAHSSSPTVEPSDIEMLLRTARACACSFDILLSSAVGEICAGNPRLLGGQKYGIDSDIDLLFLDYSERGWRQIRENALRARKVWDKLDAALTSLNSNCMAKSLAIVVRDLTGSPIKWVCPYAY